MTATPEQLAELVEGTDIAPIRAIPRSLLDLSLKWIIEEARDWDGVKASFELFEYQLHLLKRNAERLAIAHTPDPAGEAARMAAMERGAAQCGKSREEHR